MSDIFQRLLAVLVVLPALAAAQDAPLVATSGEQPAVAPAPTPPPTQPPRPDVPEPPPSFDERRSSLAVVRLSLATGGGRSQFFADGYSARAAVFLGHARLRLGASMGESLGPTLTFEAGGALQGPTETALCVDEPCEGAAPDDGTRTYSLAAARIGYEGRNAAFDIGVARFTCPGCLRVGSGVNREAERANESIGPSFTGRLGPPDIHLWGEYAAGGVSSIRTNEDTAMIPAAFGVGLRLRPAYLRIGVASQGFVGDVDVAVFDDIHVGAIVWGHDDQFAAAVRITVPLGRGQHTGRAYGGRR